MSTRPPMDSTSEEASPEQLDAARAQGEAYGDALRIMIEKVADTGGAQRCGDYEIGFALEKAEGMWEIVDGELRWIEPDDENLHVEVSVRDAADGRFIPGLDVRATVVTSDGREVGTHVQPFLWHPMLYHYGRNWTVPGDGRYDLTFRVEPAPFMRHDRKNGRRYAEPAEVTFRDVEVKTGKG